MRKGLGRIPARGWESGLHRRLWGAQIVFGGASNPRRKRQWEIEKEVLLAFCWFHCCWKIFQSFGLNEWRYIWILSLSLSPFKDFIYLLIFRGRSREGEREGERHQCERETLAASRMPPTRDLTHNPDKCPHWELNPGPFCSRAGAQSTEPPGLTLFLLSPLLSSFFPLSSPLPLSLLFFKIPWLVFLNFS